LLYVLEGYLYAADDLLNRVMCDMSVSEWNPPDRALFRAVLIGMALALVAIACGGRVSRSSRQQKLESDVATLCSYVFEHIAQHGVPPRRWEELDPKPGRTIIFDPWKNNYQLNVDASSRVIRIGSLGRDQKPGGSDTDADYFVDIAY
jgi:Type II secretion system (T2SS), protein G